MSSPRAETAVRPSTTPDEPKKASLSAAQVAASALAAVSSAVVASFFGVAGTLIGAALASVITTVCASLYATSLKKTNERLRTVIKGGQKRPEPVTRPLPAHLDPRRTPPTPIRPRWGRVAVYAVSVFAVAIAIVTGIELVGQKPVSALVSHSSSSGTTTLGELAGSSRSTSGTTTPTPSAPATTAPASPAAESSPAAPSSIPTGTSESEQSTQSSTSTPTPSSTSTSESSPPAEGAAAPTP